MTWWAALIVSVPAYLAGALFVLAVCKRAADADRRLRERR